MIRIFTASDIHLEFGRDWTPPDPDTYDVAIIPGDLELGWKGLEALKTLFPENKPVLYFPGNHEYYKNNIESVEKRVYPAIELEVDDLTILGCTLWTDFCLFGKGEQANAMLAAGYRMNDYNLIRVAELGYQKLTPQGTLKMHRAQLKWLKGRLKDLKDRLVVVATHHCPSGLSLDGCARVDDILAPAYASNLEHLMKDNPNIKLWCHGHTHHAVDYMVYDTRVVSNPLGYPGQETGYNHGLIIEV
jgi:3',5'-cyclic AMP phosphodiesterase CpdA